MMTFRTPAEAVAMANDTRYGLAASVWTENVNLALDTAPQIKAGTIWVNCTNLFDAASGFGGYRESGYGREGGREGILEYVEPAWHSQPEPLTPGVTVLPPSDAEPTRRPSIDRTAKLYIGGKQVRPDSGDSLAVFGVGGEAVAEVPRGNQKDVRNAVEAARKAARAWALRTGHSRAQILYFLAENLAARQDEWAHSLRALRGASPSAEAEVEASLQRLFTYAAWADKWDGRVHSTPFRNVTLAMPEPIGVMAAVCPNELPLLGLISLLAPTIAMGNTVVAVPSRLHPLVATDFYQVLETSDVPPGVVNILTGVDDDLRPVLAAHDDVDGMWYFGSSAGSADVERQSAGNMKRTWVNYGRTRNWFDVEQGEGEEFLREATQIKNIWVPYGE